MPELFASKWAPSARLMVALIGVASLAASTRASGLFKRVLGMFGVASLVRAATNLHFTDFIGWIANPAVRMRREIIIQAPIEDVYDFLSHFENYPKFMSYIESVEINDEGGLRWSAQGPAGIPFRWNTYIGRMIRNQSISWKSNIDSILRNSGDIQLRSLPQNRTQARIELTYVPPVGALGYAVAHILGFDPKEKIDDDLKTLTAILENKPETTTERGIL